MIVLPFSAILAGIQCLLGIHFCNSPKLLYITGVVTSCKLKKENVILILGGWYVTSLIAVLIAFDRFFEIMLPKVAKFLYDGRRVYVWMLIPFFYLFVTFCFGSAVFNYKYHAFFFDIGLQKTPQVCIKSFCYLEH